MASEVWVGRVKERLDGEQAYLSRILGHLATVRARIQELDQVVGVLERQVRDHADRERDQIRRLEGMKDDPVVLIRNYGSPDRYHSSVRPCGWATNRANYRAILLSEAATLDIKPCSSCGRLLA